MKDSCTESRFLADTATHEMTIVRDDGLYRHITFKRPGSSAYRFDLITWPGELCIRGDMGTYVFNRLPDMFEFFRTDRRDFNFNRAGGLSINAGYWGEKLVSICKTGGYREFDEDKLVARVTEYFNEWVESNAPDGFSEDEEVVEFQEKKAELWEAIDDQILDCIHDGESATYTRVHEFSHDGFYFEDFFDGGGTERYTFHYIWCLYAIAWGILRYDQAKAAEASAA